MVAMDTCHIWARTINKLIFNSHKTNRSNLFVIQDIYKQCKIANIRKERRTLSRNEKKREEKNRVTAEQMRQVTR